MQKVKLISLNEEEGIITYSFISFLREDWVERSIVIKTNNDNIIKKIYITSKYFKEIKDASEYPEFSIPPVVRRDKIKFPYLAKSMDVEATVLVRITIDENGYVLYVDILEILLNKVLPSKLTRVIEQEFT